MICGGAFQLIYSILFYSIVLLREWNLNPCHSYLFDASTSNRCPEPGEDSQVIRRAHEEHKVVPAIPANKSASLGAQLTCLCENAHSMENNKQEELEMRTHWQGHDLTGIMEM